MNIRDRGVTTNGAERHGRSRSERAQGSTGGLDQLRLCGPKLLNPVARMRHTSKTFHSSVSEKIFSNGSRSVFENPHDNKVR